MEKHCGNCANYKKETNQFSGECGTCVAAVLENGERTGPSRWTAKPQTNADRIRAMSDEELAELLVKYDDLCDVYRTDGAGVWLDEESAIDAELKWLKQPAEGE